MELYNTIKDLLPNAAISDVFEDKYLYDYLHYSKGSSPLVVKVNNKDEIIALIKYCNTHNIKLVTRGAGTNLVGSTIPHDEIILDVSNLNKILSFDKDNFELTCEPGVLLKDVQTFAEQNGLFYPPDPAEKNASIGGNISTNAGGIRAVKYGVTRDYIKELEVITGKGEVLHLGSSNIKDSTALSLKNLFIGAEGTLGIITKAKLKLISKPQITKSAIVGFSSLTVALSSVKKILNNNLLPVGIEFIENDVLALGENFLQEKLPCKKANAYLILSFDGTEKIVDDDLLYCKELIKNDVIEFLELKDVAIFKKVFSIRCALANAIAQKGIWEPVDTVVPLSKIDAFISFIKEYSKKNHIEILAFGHAGDGNVHLCVVKNDIDINDWDNILDKTLDAIYDEVYNLGGLISAEHGIGTKKKAYFLKHVNKENLYYMNEIKKIFDPNNILNSHVSFAK